MAVSTIIQYILSGALIGGVYGTAAIGLTIIFGIMEIINFAQADFLMLAMYTTYFLFSLFNMHPFISLIVVIPIFFFLGVVVQKFLINHVIDKAEITALLFTAGLQIVLQNIALVLWGSQGRTIHVPIGGKAIAIGDIFLNKAQLIGFFSSFILVIILYQFLKKTELGCIMRATIDDKELATLLGIKEKKIYMITFGIGLAVEGFAGVFLSIYYPTIPTFGSIFIVLMFVSVVLGGLKNVIGAFIGGIIIGIIQSLTTMVLWSQWQNLFIFTIFVIIMLFKPGGLFE